LINSIIDVFNDYFEMVPAISDELKNEVYKLRYQVYCVETGFENPDNHPDEMEHDEYDRHSLHYLIRHRKSGDYTATTRLILPDADHPEKLFPLEKYSRIYNQNLLSSVSRNHLAEASRFCISKVFRRRKNDFNILTSANSDWSEEQSQQTQPMHGTSCHITLALIACLIRMSRENNIHYWYAILDPNLKRFFSSLGINFAEIGPLIDLHGKQKPYIIKVDDLLSDVAKKDSSYWDLLTNKGQYWRV